MRTNDKRLLEDLILQLRAAAQEQAEVVQFLNGLRVGMRAGSSHNYESSFMADALNRAQQVQSRLTGTNASLQTIMER